MIEFFQNRGVGWFGFFVLVQNPFQGRPIAQFVRPCFRGYAREGGLFIYFNCASFFIVNMQLH